jgi:hypothetical protein
LRVTTGADGWLEVRHDAGARGENDPGRAAAFEAQMRMASSLTADETLASRAAGYEPSGTNDYLIGRDPREMTQDELRLMGHEPMSLLAIIRAKCLDCVGGSPDEVRKCVAMACPNWPVRMNKNVWRAPPSEAQREHARAMAARMRRKSSDPQNGRLENDE